ncbi:phage holin family protein [Priestia megaterium]|uniref:phage holin family protein n=1 Tax=Priestia megaterium TaxID=1404 RepID=UPI000BF4AABF|nr:phage holin family protein [Priestia megaterium]PFJ03211.1 holin [Priestia megaterium]PGR11746.1 holin [Priestia megaterium]
MRYTQEIDDLKNLMNPTLGVAGVVGGTISGAISALYGENVNMYVALLLLAVVALDWLGAIGAALKDGSYSSDYGIRGIFRTTIIFVLPLIGRLIDVTSGIPIVVAGVEISGFYLFISAGLIYHSWMSMTANFARAGYEKWIPNKMLKQVGSEINAKITRSEGRREAINGGGIELPSLESNPLVSPINEPVPPLKVNNITEEEKTDSSH